MILENFDFSILNSGEFLEDSVREEIITPILHKLGYSASGKNRIVRSKSLTHPYVFIGTQQRKINIIPDYILYVNDQPAIVLDAKAPKEDIVQGKNVEQAFSYAIHKDVRTWIYALCNGHKLTIFSLYEYEPLLEVELDQLEENWKEIERYLNPEYIERPYLADFQPDLGMSLRKINSNPEMTYYFLEAGISGIIKIAEDEYTINCSLIYGENDYMATFDFNKAQYLKFLELMPKDHKQAINECLSRQPFRADFKQEYMPEVSISANLSSEIVTSALTNESFVPFIVNEFMEQKSI